MPTYSYRCESCGVRFDHRQGFYDEPPTKCPECGEHALRKLYLPVGIVFRGSGFYSTDNRPSSYSSPAKQSSAEKVSSNGKEAGGEKKADPPSSED